MRRISSIDDFDALRESPLAFVFKHSTRCPISTAAYYEMRQVVDAHPDVPVHLIDVIADRPLSRLVAERTGVVHQSPQVILLVRGQPAWSVTHFDVRASEVGERLLMLTD